MIEPIARETADPAVLLNTVKLVDGEVEICWKDKVSSSRFSPFWLRDHCHAKHSLNADTLQRQVDTFSIPENIVPSQLEIADGGKKLWLA